MNKPARLMAHGAMCFVLCTTFCVPVGLGQTAIPTRKTEDKTEVLKKARAAYYNLRAHGLRSFETNVQPNWELVLKDVAAKEPEKAANALKLLNGIKFTLTLDSEDAVKVSHKVEVAASNAEVEKGFNQIFAGMEDAMNGFFDTWKPFMISSPLPGVTEDYKLEDIDGQYRITYKSGTAQIVTTMSKDFHITEMKTNSPDFMSVVKPKLKSTAQGLVLTGYVASYTGTGGKDITQLDISTDYQEVDGLQMLSNMKLKGSYQANLSTPNSPFDMEMAFNQYKVGKK